MVQCTTFLSILFNGYYFSSSIVIMSFLLSFLLLSLVFKKSLIKDGHLDSVIFVSARNLSRLE